MLFVSAPFQQPKEQLIMTTVSIIIPVYNNGRYIEQCINSVLAQTSSDFEIILIDDCSTDDSHDIIRRYALTHSNISLLRNITNLGPGASRNRGIQMARGKFLAFLDSDDLWEPTKLARQLDLFTRPEISVVYCYTKDLKTGATTFSKNYRGDVTKQILRSSFCVTSSVIARAYLVKECGGFAEDIWIGEDWSLWLKLALFSQFECLEEPLCIRRTHDSQVSSNNLELIRCDEIVIKRFMPQYSKYLSQKAMKYVRYWHSYKRGFYYRELGNKVAACKAYLKAWLLYPFNIKPMKAIVITLFRS